MLVYLICALGLTIVQPECGVFSTFQSFGLDEVKGIFMNTDVNSSKKSTVTIRSSPAISISSVATPFASSPSPFLKEAKMGLVTNPPELCEEGTGGTYFLKNQENANVAVFKPSDEDPLSKGNPKGSVNPPEDFHFKGIQPGEGMQREIFASQVGHEFAGVPETLQAKVCHWKFADEKGVIGTSKSKLKTKIGSLQQFIPDVECSVDDMGCSLFSVEDVQKIALLDLLLVNCDRNGGNILVQKESRKLIPIDHAFSLPDYQNLSDVQWFEWMTWKQAKLPVTDSVLSFFKDHSLQSLVTKARELRIREDCIITLQLAWHLVETALRHGLTLHAIGKLMCSSHNKTSMFAEWTKKSQNTDVSKMIANFKKELKELA